MAPRPVVTFENVDDTSVFLGGRATLTLRFDNKPDDPADVGYVPYVDVILPTNGMDGSGTGAVPENDGLTFIKALHLGVALESRLIEFDAAGTALHPYATDATGAPLIIRGTPGDTLLVLKLPFGSFTSSQTPADITLVLDLSDEADVSQLLSLTASGGFAFGADEFNNPASDPVITGAPAKLDINPVVARLHVDYIGPEQETATGPSYPRSWIAWAELARNQTFENLTITNILPDGVELTATPTLIDGITGQAKAGTVTVVRNADGTQTVTGIFANTVIGGHFQPALKMDWYVTEFLSNTALPPNTPVLDPDTGAFRKLADNARLDADWIPIDTRDRADHDQPAGTDPRIHITIDPTGAEDIVTAKSIAIQKGVSLVSGDADKNGVKDWQPGGTLKYTLDGQVSNYFEMKDLVVKDTLGDGQTFDAATAPTITIREGGKVIYTGPVLMTIGVGGAGPTAKNADGTTPIEFDVSGTLRAAGIAGVDDVLDGNGGALGAVPHATDYQQATILITFHTTLDETWTGSVPLDGLVDQGDPIANDVIYAGAVYRTGERPQDDSGASIDLPVSKVSKSIYAINGDISKGTTSFDTPSKTQAGDLITFRIGLDLPLTSAHKVTLTDFLPLPVLRAMDADADPSTPAAFTFVNLADASIPDAGQVKFGPADTFHLNVPGNLPTLSIDARGNGLLLDFGDVVNAAYPRTQLDLLVTLRVNDKPFGDGLLLTNQVTSGEVNSFGDRSGDNAIIQFILGEPILKLTKGVIATDNPISSFGNPTTLDGTIGPVAFSAPGSAGPRFGGTITSDMLGQKPVDANLSTADAGDTLSFAIILENRGQGWKGAFDTLVRDILPAGYVAPGAGAAGINLQITDGTGAALGWKVVGGGLFDPNGGIEILDRLDGTGALGSYDPSSGKNIAVITYDLKLVEDLVHSPVALTNTATLVHYAAAEGGIDRTAEDDQPDSDTASVTIHPEIFKAVTATSLADTGAAQGNPSLEDLAIGETVTYTITVKLPEGVSQGLQILDLLPNGNGQLEAIGAMLSYIGANITGGPRLVLGQAATLSDRNADGIKDSLLLDLGTVANKVDNTDGDVDLLKVEVVARVADTAANRALDGQTLVNTATVSFQDPADPTRRFGFDAAAAVEVVKPHLAITKDISQGTGDAADILTYTVRLTNQVKGYDGSAYDIVIDDNLVAGLGTNATLLANSLKLLPGSAPASIVAGTAAGAPAIRITAAELDPGQSIRFSFQARTSDTVASGNSFTNTVTATGTTLPGPAPVEHTYTVSDTVTFGVDSPVVVKSVHATSYADTGSVRGASATDADVKVNETVTYRITVTLPEGVSENLRVIDSLADLLATGTSGGLLAYVAGSAKVVSVGGALSGSGLLANPTISVADSTPANTYPDQIRFDFGTVFNDPNIAVAGGDDIVLELKAIVADVAANQPGDVLANGAYAATDRKQSATSIVTIDFVQPVLTVDKSVDKAAGDAGHVFTYTITVAHAAGSSANAYDIDLTDLLPAGQSYVAGSLSGASGLSFTGGTVRLKLDSLALGASPVTFTYQARLADDVVHGQVVNNAAVLDWQTAATGQSPSPGRTFTATDDAPVAVVLSNAVTKDLAGTTSSYTTGNNAGWGETVTFSITASLAEGAQRLLLADILPTGLTYAASRVAAVNGITGAGLAVGAAGTWDAASRTVSFDFGSVVNAGDNDPATGFVTVTVDATVATGTAIGSVLTNTVRLSPQVPANGYGVTAGTALPVVTDAEAVTVVAARLGNLVFLDRNGNGIQDAGEAGVNGITVRLLDPANGDALVATTTTATAAGVAGSYSFDSLVPGQYRVQFLAGGDHVLTPANQGTDDARDSDAATTDGRTGVYTLQDSAYDDSVDAGLYIPIRIGDLVFEDTNGNRQWDGGEPGIAGVTVQLLDSLGNPIAGRSVTTLSDGKYLFTGLAPGSYGVQFTRPDGSSYVITGTGGADPATDSNPDPVSGKTTPQAYLSGTDLAGSTDLTIDAGFYRPASLGNRVWLDTNGNGVQDAAETSGLAGVQVRLLAADGVTQVGSTITTTSTGAYSFTNLRPGDYFVSFTAPTGHRLTKSGGGAGDLDSDAVTTGGVTSATTGKITLVSGQSNDTVDAGFWQPVTIGNRVFRDANLNGVQDTGENGLGSSVTVTLLNSAGETVATTTANSSTGAYSFTTVAPGTYQLRFSTPTNFVITTRDAATDDLDSDIDSGGLTPLKTYVSGDVDNTIDAGLWRAPAIGDRVFLDNNGNGIFDSGDTSIANATVRLFDAAGNQVGSPVTTNTSSGNYRFSLLQPGSYSVQVTAPAGHLFTLQDRGTNDAIDSDANPATGRTGLYTLVEGADQLTVDIGVYRTVTIGDRAFEDLNGNGIFDAGEPGLNGVAVTIVNTLTNESFSTVTAGTGAGTGSYSFTGLRPGNWQQSFTAPTGYALTVNGRGTAATDSDPDPATGIGAVFAIASGATDTTRDVGLYRPVTIGDRVWRDADADGIQDAGEQGLQGVTVRLVDAAGNPVAGQQTVTDANGAYSFSVIPGQYAVEFVTPTGHVRSPSGQGTAATDSDANPATGRGPLKTYLSGDTDSGIDAGFYQTVTIGDRVFNDLNGNGRDDGEPGISGVAVTLLNAAGGVAGATTTDATGAYRFEGVTPGRYQVRFETPSSWTITAQDAAADSADSDIDTNGLTPLRTYVSGDVDTSVDAGFWRPASIGNRVWLDTDGDGVQDGTEAGIDGVTVQLLDAAGTQIAEQQTKDGGAYRFTLLPPGDYSVRVVLSGTSYAVTLKDRGGDAADSDADPATLVTGRYTLVAAQDETSADIGLYVPVSIGNKAWEDLNGNGVQEAGEPGVNGVTVTLTNALSGESVTTTTAFSAIHGDGAYQVTGLRPGTWQPAFVAPAGWVFTPDARGTAATDSDPNPATGIAPAFDIPSGMSDQTHDVGLYRPITVGGRAFLDGDADGVQDPGEQGLSGVSVQLLGAGGLPVAGRPVIATQADGSYSFTGLPPGTYSVVFGLPGGHVRSPTGQGTRATDSDAGAGSGATAPQTYVSGADDRTVDAGFYLRGSIGDRVWLDTDGDGRQGDGEQGIADILVRLLREDGSPTGLETRTKADGSYVFSGLDPGRYRVGFEAPDGLVFTRPDVDGTAGEARDSDADRATGITGVYTLTSGGTIATVDAGLYRRVTIGDRVWEDTDGDGRQGSTELGLDGITVTLVDDVTGARYTQQTANGGAYLFVELPPSRYHLEFGALAGWRFTQQVAGAAAADSDARADGTTTTFDLSSGGGDITRDAGLYRPGALSGRVTLDLPPGICDTRIADAVFAGLTVRLTNLRDGGSVEALTDGSGRFAFTDLAPAPYRIEYLLPGGTTLVGSAGAAETVTLLSGQDLAGFDRALRYQTGSLLDGVPVEVPAGTAYDVIGSSQYVVLPGGGTVNMNSAGNFVIGGQGGINANGNVGGQYVIGGVGNNILHSGPEGSSVLVGGRGGTNVFEGSADPDIMVGGCGPNNMQALGTSKAWLAGYDILLGGPGQDTLESNDSLALLFGGGGNDDIHGSGTLIGGEDDGTIGYDADANAFIGFRFGDHVKGGNGADTFIYQAGDGVDWIGSLNIAQGDRLHVYGHAGPVATGRVDGFEVLYFGPNSAVVFNSAVPTNGIVYHPETPVLPGAFGRIAALPPVVLSPGVSSFYGTEGDDIAVGTVGTRFRGNGGDDLLIGSNAADWFDTGDGNNTVLAKHGADVVLSGAGNNSIDGGGGTDKVVYDFASSDALWYQNPDQSWTLQRVAGGTAVKTDLLSNLETLSFTDQDVTIAIGQAALAPARDFDGDGNNDYLFRAADGSAAIWHMNGTSFVGGGSLGNPGTAWSVAGVGDFDGDGRSDILWRYVDGTFSLWLMDGLVAKATHTIWNPGTDWKIAATSDFNGDGYADLLWRHDSGTISLWQMEGPEFRGGGAIANVANDWSIADTGDFNGDGKADILWRHATGAVSEWWMDGTTYVGGATFGAVDTTWHIVGTGDFNGDRKSDILWRHEGGTVSLWLMDGAAYLGGGTIANPGTAWKVAGIDDFNGDSLSDILWRNDNGAISVWYMDGLSGTGGGFVANPGALWHLV